MMMRPLTYPLTPVPALISTNVFLYTSPPTRCCNAFLKCPKDGAPGKSDGKTCVSVSLCVSICANCTECKKVRTCECVFLSAVRGYTLTSFLICALFSSLDPPKLSSLMWNSAWTVCMDSSSDCNPDNCIHRLRYLYSDQVLHYCFIL